MRAAVILSGRITRYESCLLPILQSHRDYEVDLFISVNGTDCEYYDEVRKVLQPWLKGLYIAPYQFPEGFRTHFENNDQYYHYQLIDLPSGERRWLPRNQLSMYYNDKKAFQMAVAYEETHGFEYDAYIRFRADLFNTCLPDITGVKHDSTIHSVSPICNFISYGKHKRWIVSGDWVWGNRGSMAVYCNTYDYVLAQNLLDFKYLFHFESNFTDCLADNGVPVTFHEVHYNIDSARKCFDENWLPDDQSPSQHRDSRSRPPKGHVGYVDIRDYKTVMNLPLVAD